jgi:hypothetical protein
MVRDGQHKEHAPLRMHPSGYGTSTAAQSMSILYRTMHGTPSASVVSAHTVSVPITGVNLLVTHGTCVVRVSGRW